MALRPSHFRLADLEIKVQQQLIETDSGNGYLDVPKHGSFRTVTFAAFVQHDLKELIERCREASGQDDPLLFCAPEGGFDYRRNHTRRFHAAADRAGWPRHIT